MMLNLSPRQLPPTFLPSLNSLLASLDLPFALDNPTDLTPSLLLAILESLINARLPIPQTVRVSRTRDAKARAMLVLLGVLECDVLRGGTEADHPQDRSTSTHVDDSVLGAGGVSVDGWADDIGLGDVDPERLADGGWEETIFVGELLCWLARRKGILPRLKRPHGSATRTTRTCSLYSNRHSYGDEEGDTADFSSSLLFRPSPARRPRFVQAESKLAPEPPHIDDLDSYPDLDVSALSHITDVPRHPLVHSPEPSLSHSNSGTAGTELSIRAHSVSSRTSLSGSHEDEYEEVESEGTVHPYEGDHDAEDEEDEGDEDHPPIFRPHCIHELEDPSYIRALAGPSSFSFGSHDHTTPADEDEDDPSDAEEDVPGSEDLHPDDREEEQDTDDAPPTPTPRRVRLTGWIDEVDTATELSQFAASRSRSSNSLLGSRQRPQLQSNSNPPSFRVGSGIGSELRMSSGRSSGDENIKKWSGGEGSGPPSKPTVKTHPPAPTPARTTSIPPSSSLPKPRSALASSSLNFSSADPPQPPLLASEPMFDVSFSAMINTSTPAKPKPQRRSQIQLQAQTETRKAVNSGEKVTRRQSARSPSYTPSPPSFSSPPGSHRGASSATKVPTSHRRPSSEVIASVSSSSRAQAPTRMRTIDPDPRPLTSTTKTASSHKTQTSTSSPRNTPMSGSTSMTASLLTERARLLTELAALKRVRSMSAGRGGGGTVGVGVGV
ncbi:hypothetical protein BDN67DRAFT_334894 [Paxillus ammoniavirescens]|nr:hypothetical protein BDN67DRAFT_334894 [Paxillus ammoniavirescens]